MKTKALSAQAATGEGDESPFAGKASGKKGGLGGLSFGRVLSQSTSALAGQGAKHDKSNTGVGFAGQFGQEIQNAGVKTAFAKDGLAVAKSGAGEKGLEDLGRVVSDEDASARKAIRAGSVTKPTASGKAQNAQDVENAQNAEKAQLARKGDEGHVSLLTATSKEDGKPAKAVVEKTGAASKAEKVEMFAGQSGPKTELSIEGLAKASLQTDKLDNEASAKGKVEKPAQVAETAAKPLVKSLERGTPATPDILGDAPKEAQKQELAATNGATAKANNGQDGKDGKDGSGEVAQESLEALLAAARPRLARGPALPGAADTTGELRTATETKTQAREEGPHAADEGKKVTEPNGALTALQSAGLIDFRMPLIHPGVAGDEDSHGGAIAAAGGNAADAAAADLAAALHRELDRPGAPNATTFTLPPPPPVTATGSSGVADVAPTIAPGSVLAPAELGMMPEDPALNLAVMNRAAHLSIEGQDGRSLELHVRLLPEGAEIRANGELASLVQSKASDLGAALAAEGMNLSRFELTQDRRHDGHHDPRANGNDDGDHYRPVAARRAASHTGAVDTVTRTSDGRIHVKA